MTSPTTPAPTGWPVPDIRFADAVKRGFSGYVAFDGRASRAEFWYWYLFVVGTVLVLVLPSVAIATATSSDGTFSPVAAVGLVIGGLFYAAVVLPTIAVACRRLHDAGYSGLFLLLGLVTGLIPLVMCLLPTSPAAARFGPPGQPGFPGQPVPPPGAYGPQPYGPQPYGPPPGHGAPAAYGQAPHPTPYGQQPPGPDGRFR